MDINIDFGITVVELDQLIRRALQDHYLEIQPPVAVWGSILSHLAKEKHGVPAHLRRGFQSDTTSDITQHSDQG
jgi:hypothetical protein